MKIPITTHLKLLKELSDNSEEWYVIQERIKIAQNSIFVSTFFIEPDSFGYDFLRLMIQAVGRGVRCVILTDQSGERLVGYMHRKPNDLLLRTLWQEFKKAGGVHVLTRPQNFIANTLSHFVTGGNHFKFLIFDKKFAIITGRNIGVTCFGSWADYGALVEGPIIAQLLLSFADLLKINQTQHGLDLDSLQPVEAPFLEDHEEVLYFDFDPIHHGGALNPFSKKTRNTITDWLSLKISEARSKILISSFMFKPTSSLLNAILAASQNGVKIKLITSSIKALPNFKACYWAAACGYKNLLKAGIEIYETLLPEHSKLVVIDGQWAAFGSYNFEYAAHDRLREGMVMSQNPAFIQRIKKILEEKCKAHVSRRIMAQNGDWKTFLGYSIMRPVRWFF